MTKLELSKKIKQAALNLDFDLVGITDAANPESFSVFQSWIDAGNHGEMGYLSSERSLANRANFQNVLPGCQSVVVLVKRINPSLLKEEVNKFHGRVASYAWNLDYHDTLVPLLKELTLKIEKLAEKPVASRYYTDTGPILERDLAARAGLGWVGKNSMLINPQIGSFFLLSEILLDIPLTPDQPIEDHCGNCRNCIESCPTSCILPNRTINSRRCLSYLTIELKTKIPLVLRPVINEWVFGCDICQQVCPWNQRFAESTFDSNFAPRAGVPQPDLLSELKLTPEEFNLKFKNSPVKRSKRRGYLRNVITSLGNTKAAELIPHISPLLHNDHEHLVRQHAAWALGQIGSAESKQHLEQALNIEEDEKVIEEIKLAIKEIR